MQNKEVKAVNVSGQEVEIFDSTTHQPITTNNVGDVVADKNGDKWQLQEDWYQDNYCGASWVKIS